MNTMKVFFTWYTFIIILATNNTYIYSSKIIGLVPVHNEELYITQCLKALALYTDAIVVLDDASNDKTLALVQSLVHECRIEKIIQKKMWHRDEPGDRNRLLQEGRALGGTHFIVLDADEMFTANCLNNNFLRDTILALKPGDKLRLNWIALWRDVKQYRFDPSVWTYNYKDFIFCDNGMCSYFSNFIHTARTPTGLNGCTRTIEGYTYGVLHFQFVNWENLLIKQAWYRCLEHIRRSASIAVINDRYAPSKNEKNIKYAPSPAEWFDGYSFFDPTAFDKPEQWRKKQVNEWFAQYGREFFKELDIWDINWTKNDQKKT